MSCNDVLYVVYYCTVNVVCCVKGSVVHGNRQQCLVAKWLGLSVTVRVRVRATAREYIFNPRRTCAARVTVLHLSVCLSVCVSVCLCVCVLQLAWLTRRLNL